MLSDIDRAALVHTEGDGAVMISSAASITGSDDSKIEVVLSENSIARVQTDLRTCALLYKVRFWVQTGAPLPLAVADGNASRLVAATTDTSGGAICERWDSRVSV